MLAARAMVCVLKRPEGAECTPTEASSRFKFTRYWLHSGYSRGRDPAATDRAHVRELLTGNPLCRHPHPPWDRDALIQYARRNDPGYYIEPVTGDVPYLW